MIALAASRFGARMRVLQFKSSLSRARRRAMRRSTGSLLIVVFCFAILITQCAARSIDLDRCRNRRRPRSAGHHERAGCTEETGDVPGLRAEVLLESAGRGLRQLADRPDLPVHRRPSRKLSTIGDKALAGSPHDLDILVSQANIAQQAKNNSKLMDYVSKGGEVCTVGCEANQAGRDE